MMERQPFYLLLVPLSFSLLGLGFSSDLFIARADLSGVLNAHPPREEVQKIADTVMPEIRQFSILAIAGIGGALVVKAFTGK